MAKLEKEIAEIAVGGSLLIFSFVVSFLMVIGVIEKSIVLSMLAFSLSMAGLAVGLHGIYGLVASRRRAAKQRT